MVQFFFFAFFSFFNLFLQLVSYKSSYEYLNGYSKIVLYRFVETILTFKAFYKTILEIRDKIYLFFFLIRYFSYQLRNFPKCSFLIFLNSKMWKRKKLQRRSYYHKNLSFQNGMMVIFKKFFFNSTNSFFTFSF